MKVIISKKSFDPRVQTLRHRIYAAGLSRILHDAINGPFAILSAWRGNVKEHPELLGPNKADDIALRSLINEAGYGFVRLYGIYAYMGPEQGRLAANEESLFIPGIPKELAHQLAQACMQESFIWGDGGKYALFETATGNVFYGVKGDVATDFRMIRDEEDPDFASTEKGPIRTSPDGKLIREWTDEKGQKRNLRLWRLDDSRSKQKEETEVPAGSETVVASKDRKYLFYAYGLMRTPCQIQGNLSGVIYEGQYGPGGPDPRTCEALIPLKPAYPGMF
ncbi:MAG TPA: hypothetical protein PK235_14830 [Phycisphaerae bacterium]|nr:hypothetical protein [Phycisphaerae bacterium]